MVDLEVLALIAVASVLAEAVTEKIFKPIRENLIFYFAPLEAILDALTPLVAWGLAGAFVALTGVNIFPSLLPGTAGIVVTAIISGVGANRLHDIFSFPKRLAQEKVLAEAAYDEWADTLEDFPTIDDIPEG